MGFGIKENIFSCAGFYKLLQNPADSGIIHAGVQLSVRKGTGTALAKLHIAFFIQATGLPEYLYLFMACKRVFSPLQHQRMKSRYSKHQGRKHSGRSKTHHYRPFFWIFIAFWHLIIFIRRNRGPFAAGLPKDLIFIAIHCHIHGVDDFYIRLLSCIHRTAHNAELPNF